jgi:hypothetical protein
VSTLIFLKGGAINFFILAWSCDCLTFAKLRNIISGNIYFSAIIANASLHLHRNYC